MFLSVATTDFTPCLSKKSRISRQTFGLSFTLVPTHRFKTGSAPSRWMTDGAILVVRLAELKSDPSLRTIPVIMFSTSDAQEDIDGAYGEGANTFITKPVTIGDLKEVLNRIADYWAKTARLPTGLGATTEEMPRIWRSAS